MMLRVYLWLMAHRSFLGELWEPYLDTRDGTHIGSMQGKCPNDCAFTLALEQTRFTSIVVNFIELNLENHFSLSCGKNTAPSKFMRKRGASNIFFRIPIKNINSCLAK